MPRPSERTRIVDSSESAKFDAIESTAQLDSLTQRGRATFHARTAAQVLSCPSRALHLSTSVNSRSFMLLCRCAAE